MPVEYMKRESVTLFFGEEGLRPVPCEHRMGGKPPGYYTDDTCMALCLAESLALKGFDRRDQFERYRKWLFEGYMTPDNTQAFGIGRRTLLALMVGDADNLPELIKEDGDEAGNGPLMRCAPLGLYLQNLHELKEKTKLATIMTHNSSTAVWGCVVLTTLVALALRGVQKQTLLPEVLRLHPEMHEEAKGVCELNFSAIPEVYEFPTSGYTMNTLRIALWAFFTTDNYRECITRAIYVGGDTDTQAAVAGALAGTYYGIEGISNEFIDALISKERILGLADQLHEKVRTMATA